MAITGRGRKPHDLNHDEKQRLPVHISRKAYNRLVKRKLTQNTTIAESVESAILFYTQEPTEFMDFIYELVEKKILELRNKKYKAFRLFQKVQYNKLRKKDAENSVTLQIESIWSMWEEAELTTYENILKNLTIDINKVEESMAEELVKLELKLEQIENNWK